MVKKYIVLITFITFTIFSNGYSFNKKNLWRGKLMSLDKVCKKWGEEKYNLNKFKASINDESVRAKMSCSIIKDQKKFVGKTRTEIWNMFGKFNGFYFSDMFPAYIIESADKVGQDTWQLLFFLDRNRKISEIVVHKNCCDN